MQSQTYFYIAPEGTRFGPATLQELAAWAARGFITPRSTIEDAAGTTVVASSVAGLDFNAPTLGSAPAVESNYPRTSLDAGVPIPNGLIKSVFSTFCIGCLPLGVVALYNSLRVDGLVREGRYDEARAISKRADTIANIAIIIGGVGFILKVVLIAMSPHHRSGY